MFFFPKEQREAIDMKLNPDCIRKLLLWLEENQKIDALGNVEEFSSLDLPHKISSFSERDILYSVKQMISNGLLAANPVRIDGCDIYWISDITPAGHEFLENIRQETNWNKTKTSAAKIGSSALSVLIQIASGVVTAAVKSQIGIP